MRIHHHGADFQPASAGAHPHQYQGQKNNRGQGCADLVGGQNHAEEIDLPASEQLWQRFGPRTKHPEQDLIAGKTDRKGRNQGADRKIRFVMDGNERNQADEHAADCACEDTGCHDQRRNGAR